MILWIFCDNLNKFSRTKYLLKELIENKKNTLVISVFQWSQLRDLNP